jgi:putative ABC transport system permease protein
MFSLISKTLLHYRYLLLPVAFGVAVASAVIVGALVVGDSMRGSLRHIAMDRIGNIDTVLIAPRWFDESLASGMSLGVVEREVLPTILVRQAIAEHQHFRANELSLLGVDDAFWKMGSVSPETMPGDEQVVVNQTLAEKLHVKVGDLVTLRIASQSVVPADSPLGKREQDFMVLPRWKVVSILPDRSLARFSLQSDQRPTMNAFASKKWLQNALEIQGKVNSIFVGAGVRDTMNTSSIPEIDQLLGHLPVKPEDVGIKQDRVRRHFPDQSLSERSEPETTSPTQVLDYVQLTSDQMLIVSSLSDSLLEKTRDLNPIPILTYLANGAQRIEAGEPAGRSIPYSTISAVPWQLLQSMLPQTATARSPLPENWIVLNEWMAQETKAKPGDTIRIEYFLPETVDGTETERSADFVVVAIAPLVQPVSKYSRNRVAKFDQAPSVFNDPAWTPVVPGITDQESIDKWDAPFPLTRKRDTQDEDYWDYHRLTPKMFVSQDLGVRLFGSRFGNVTSIRYSNLSESQTLSLEKSVTEVVRRELPSLGWRSIPLRSQQTRASSGTTPFDALFLSLSFFVILAALLLVALLFRLAIEQRADHWGLLLASGWTSSSVRRWLLAEGVIVSALGSTLGILLGLGYAYVMLAGLKTWWIGAISVSFLDFYVRPLSLALGWILGWLTAVITILIATQMLKRIPAAKLLKKNLSQDMLSMRGSRWIKITSVVCVGIGLLGLVVGQAFQGQAQAGAFMGAGMLFLVGGLAWVYQNLCYGSASSTTSGITDSSLAGSNAKRAPMRSILAIGLVAIASFLILSMSLFQAQPNEAGTGGFDLLGKSTHPIYRDLGNATVRKDVLGDKSEVLAGIEIVPLRVQGGDDASCNNLFQASAPQVLGISSRIESVDRNKQDRSAFAWFSTGVMNEGSTPWSLLERAAAGSKEFPIPVVLDQNTALWALHLGGYVGERFSYTFDDREVFFETVGVLQNTILQGSLLIGEDNFEKAFPSVSGYKQFLLKLPEGTTKELVPDVQQSMEEGWSEEGLSLADSDVVLKKLLAVQNTYLSAFQSLGTLGLLLGTIGLAVAQLRSAMERRGELAAMRAIGFTKRRLTWLLALENGWQLFRGIGIGVGAAVLATLPAILSGHPFAGFWGPSMMLGLVIAVGLGCSAVAAWLAMRWPLLQSLRSM